MITQTTINLFPIVKYIGIFSLIGIAIFLLHNGYGTRLFIKKDEKIADKFLEKFPLVNPNFFNKSSIMRDAENNQELHEVNKRLDVLEINYKYITEQLNTIMGEIKKRG